MWRARAIRSMEVTDRTTTEDPTMPPTIVTTAPSTGAAAERNAGLLRRGCAAFGLEADTFWA